MVGSLLGIVLIVQIITGIWLATNYIGEIERENISFSSIEKIMREIPYGYMIRYMHSNGARNNIWNNVYTYK